MKRYKRLYIVSLILIAVVLTSVYFSYAFFTSKNEQHGKLNVLVGDLKYKLESSDLVNGSITVPAGETKEITLTLTSLNSISSKYEIYYNLTNSNNIEVGYLNVPASGTVGANEVIEIDVLIKNKGTSSTTVTFDLEKGLVNNQIVLTDGNSLSETSLCDYNIGYVWNFNYTGGEQTFTVPENCSGTYKIETWGASGAPELSDGSYTSGNILLDANTKLYVYVGQVSSTPVVRSGIITPATFNGGGSGGYGGTITYSYYSGRAGGGATDIRLINGTWSNFDSLKSRIMVAGGAGGRSANSLEPSAAGGLSNYGYIKGDTGVYTSVGNANQTQGYSFGIGQNGPNSNGGGYCHGHGGGGGGYYGGIAGLGGYGGNCYSDSGSGGSSFISGHNGCDAISSSSTSSNIIHTGQPNHYSGYVFTNTVMIDGEGYNWTNTKESYVGQPQPDGTIASGHSGNGYARITYVSPDPKTGDNWKFDYTGNIKKYIVPISGTYKLEVWGAQGNYYSISDPQNFGAYSTGYLKLNKRDSLYVVVGEMGKECTGTLLNNVCSPTVLCTNTGGYNGGGDGRIGSKYGSGGGGATHIGLQNALLKNTSSGNVIIVASGGGGTATTSVGGAGGGYIGNDGYDSLAAGTTIYGIGFLGTGGTQTAGGSTYDSGTLKSIGLGSYGLGGTNSTTDGCNANGGGGGYYGGGASHRTHGSAGGGSSYIGNSLLSNKAMYCYNCATSNEVSTKTISTTCHSSNPTVNCAKEGNGYARITLVSID